MIPSRLTMFVAVKSGLSWNRHWSGVAPSQSAKGLLRPAGIYLACSCGEAQYQSISALGDWQEANDVHCLRAIDRIKSVDARWK